MADKTDKKAEASEELKKVRITLSAGEFAVIQDATSTILKNAQNSAVKVHGPVRLPNKHLRISCRRSPCGEGSKTWDCWEMTIFKRYLDLECSQSQINTIAKIPIQGGLKISIDISREV